MIMFRTNQLHKLWKMNNIILKSFFSNLSVEYQENINFLQSFNIVHLKRNNFEIHDIKINPVDWNNFISNNCRIEHTVKRIPALMITYLTEQKKLNVLDSFLYYILNDERFHDPYIILSILSSTLDNNNYLNNFIQMYEKIVPENIYDNMFSIYMKIMLQSENRGKALNLLNNREMDQTYLQLIITTSPKSENWDDIKRYVDEYLSLDDNLFSIIEDKIFSKLINEKSISVLESILQVLNKRKVFLKSQTFEQIQLIFQNHSEMEIRRNSVANLKCKNCNSHLPKIQFSNETCNKLADILMTDVMKINSIDKLYQSSSPKEIENFFSFFKTCKLPFDCIIDLPNFIGLIPLDKQSQWNLTDNYAVICLKEFIENNNNFKNICFIGKSTPISRFYSVKSMNKFINALCKIKSDLKFSYYFSNNCKKDDILTLFLALKSGPNCYVITNDEFRDHRALISDEHLKAFFAKWQGARQIFMPGYGGKLLGVQKFLIPSQEDITVHHDPINNIWHVPYAPENQIKLSFHKFVNWCCLKLPGKQFS